MNIVSSKKYRASATIIFLAGLLSFNITGCKDSGGSGSTTCDSSNSKTLPSDVNKIVFSFPAEMNGSTPTGTVVINISSASVDGTATFSGYKSSTQVDCNLSFSLTTSEATQLASLLSAVKYYVPDPITATPSDADRSTITFSSASTADIVIYNFPYADGGSSPKTAICGGNYEYQALVKNKIETNAGISSCPTGWETRFYYATPM